MPPRAVGDGLSGVPGRTGERPAAGEQDGRPRDWPRPTSKKQVKSFLGLVGYYQRFIPGFATLASPLNDLTRKALPDRIRWSKAAEKAFGTLRGALCSEPVLITPDFGLPLIVNTDASEVGLADILKGSRGLIPGSRKKDQPGGDN